MLGDVLDFQQQPAALLADGDFGHGAIEDSVDASGRRPGQFALHHALAALPGALEQRQQRLRAAREFGDPPAERLIGPEPQQCLRGGIQVVDLQVVIQQEHAGDQGIEQFGALDLQMPAS